MQKQKQRCVMGVGMCLYAQLVQTKNKQCESAIILQCYHPHLSDFCSRSRLTQPYNHIIYPDPISGGGKVRGACLRGGKMRGTVRGRL